jgi:sugar phosphate permease
MTIQTEHSLSVARSDTDQRLKYAIFLFILICLAYLFVTFHRVSPAVIALDIMRDTGIGGTVMGIMSSVFFLTFGFMQLPSGILADSLGPRRTLPLFLTLAGIGAIFFGTSSSVGALMVSRALMGFGVSVVFVCGVKLMTNWFPPNLFARMNGMFLGMGGVGLILGSGPMAYMCTELGWRTSLIISGIVTMIIAAALFRWVRNSPEDKGFLPYPDANIRFAPHDSMTTMKNSVSVIFRNREFWLIAIWFFCHFTLHNSFGGLWGGTYLMDVHNMSKVDTGSILNMMGLGMLAGGPFAGWLSDSFFRARRPVMLFYALGMCATYLVLALYGEHFPVWGLYLWFFCLAAVGMGSLSVGFASMRDIFGAAATGTASGFLNTFPSIGVVLFQPATGWILESFGKKPQGGFLSSSYATVCFLYAGTAIIGFIAAWLAKEPMRGK